MCQSATEHHFVLRKGCDDDYIILENIWNRNIVLDNDTNTFVLIKIWKYEKKGTLYFNVHLIERKSESNEINSTYYLKRTDTHDIWKRILLTFMKMRLSEGEKTLIRKEMEALAEFFVLIRAKDRHFGAT